MDASPLGNLFIPTNPIAASRPKVARWGGVYYGKNYTKWRELCQELCPQGQLRATDPLLVLVDYIVEKPKKPTNPFPYPDLDNYDKATYDGIGELGGYWEDDKQIVVGMSRKRYQEPGEDVGTLIEFYKHTIH